MHQESHEPEHAHDDPHGHDAPHSHPHEHGPEHPPEHPHEHGHGDDHGHGHDHPHPPHSHEHSGDGQRPRRAGLLRALGGLLAVGLVGVLIYSVCFFVDETEYVYVTEFGKPQRLCIQPGMEFKLPYQSLLRLDRRLQMASPPGSQVLTRDKPRGDQDKENLAQDKTSRSLGGPPLSIEWYVCWRLPTAEFAAAMGTDLKGNDLQKLQKIVLRFLQSVGSVTAAQDRLRERIDSLLKARVGRMSLSQFVSLNADEIELDHLARELTQELRRIGAEQFGVEVVDVRIKRFNHPDGVKPAIFRMIETEREGVAKRYRAEGESEAKSIRSQADLKRDQILSKAYADAQRIRGEGDAEAMRIANAAHSADPQFYQFLKTLETYRAILNEKTTIVLSSESSLLKLLTEGMPNLTSPERPARQAGPPTDGNTKTPPTGSRGNGNREEQP